MMVDVEFEIRSPEQRRQGEMLYKNWLMCCSVNNDSEERAKERKERVPPLADVGGLSNGKAQNRDWDD